MNEPVKDELWLTKKVAIVEFGIASRTLGRYLQQRKIRFKSARLPGDRSDRTLVSAADLAALLGKPLTKGCVDETPPAPLEAPPAKHAPRYVPEPERRPRQWATLHEAAEWSGLPVEWLRHAVQAGAVHAINVAPPGKRPRWRIDRDQLGAAVALP